MSAFEVEEYSIANFIKILTHRKVGNISSEIARGKLHSIFFEEYFAKTEAKTILVEYEYVDRDYLEDFSAYYVRSFKQYRRFCTRLHFFSQQFTKKHFELVLQANEETPDTESIKKSYLGFIVIKPLPQTLIGRTCLITYPYEDKRYFPFIRPYKVNLYGISLEVKTIAFQEQDSIVAACASSAIWVAFQATGKLFQHEIPSPVEITKAATKNIPYADRYFPNKGLNAEQIAHAIRSQALEPLLINANKLENIKASVYAYLNAKIPLIMGVELCEKDGDNYKVFGGHAVTVTGYSLGGILQNDFKVDYFLESSRIDEIYVHDDQIGPFARMKFLDDVVVIKGENVRILTTSWFNKKGEIGNVYAIPKIIITPLYHKIRIPFNNVMKIGLLFNAVYNDKREKLKLPFLTWDLVLIQVGDLKKDLRKCAKIDPNEKLLLLTKEMPRFIWRLKCAIDGSGRVDFLFDATDIDQGIHYFSHLAYDNMLVNLFRIIFDKLDSSVIKNPNVRAMIEDMQGITTPTDSD